jgi:hypothetical protein
VSNPSNLLYIEIADDSGYIGRSDAYFEVDPLMAIGTLLTALGIALGDVQNCSDGRVVKAQARLGVDVSPWEARPIATGAAASNCVTLAFAHNAADDLPWDFLVPAVSSSVLSGGKPDMTEGATIDVLADVLENLTPVVAGLTFVTNRGGALGPTASGFLCTRKRSRLFSRQTMDVVP